MWQLKLVSLVRRLYLTTINFSLWSVNEKDKSELKKYNVGKKKADTMRDLAVQMAQKAESHDVEVERTYGNMQRTINASDNILRNLRDDVNKLKVA